MDVIRRLSALGFFFVPRGDSLDAIIDRITQLVDQVSDDSAAASLHFARAQRAQIAGDYALAIDQGLLAAKDTALRRIYLSLTMRPALWGRDLARARQVADQLDATVETGADVTASRLASRAGIAALEGRIDEALAGYRQSLSVFRSIHADWLVAGHELDLIMVVGGDHPAAREAAAEARPILERIKARAWLEVLDAAMARQATEDALADATKGGALSHAPG